ncbi:MAG: hypothetical protein EOO14_10990 [Chitinophagaceae bacterium]|nr:MAG: hypothetical protein EOO14_10990 [Chitinophagaceae bacterium]
MLTFFNKVIGYKRPTNHIENHTNQVKNQRLSGKLNLLKWLSAWIAFTRQVTIFSILLPRIPLNRLTRLLTGGHSDTSRHSDHHILQGVRPAIGLSGFFRIYRVQQTFYPVLMADLLLWDRRIYRSVFVRNKA